MTDLATLRARLESLNESIYEPEQHMQPSERARRMRDANAVIRKHANKNAAVPELIALGFHEKTAYSLVIPDFCGRVGFADYQLKNNGSEIRRLRARIEGLERDKAADAVELEGERARVEDCPADNRVRLFFPDKPDAEVRTRLKRSGFRWSPTIGCWQAYRNHGSIETARREAGVTT